MIRALYRYPVKSTSGQTLSYANVTEGGLEHDRKWAIYTEDGGIASGKRTRRFRPVPG
ncbi:MOSC N-terminal beta barrel domain-containing protein [Arthrobacter sp. ISL-95]|uniref:MOSC N-terminal beta barrel domain-containing protein n=1 Tax=Arthrobacter sp. ISL-95 TaxID=2819116 RepID=UPI001BEA151D|nr:MOSC N-terminal beta barrel domain-containing protein [Arthrobacter sp. ISL-95]